MSSKILHCAVYTRKSHSEGLEQEFNSLDAQRQAGVDYIKSQKHEGWRIVSTRYDDGGYSGATLERPALQRLFDDVETGAIDVVVVYKVDRLSRSISDFAQIVERFSEREVSFVSVTQQFNTATSMGRLTLNMLLSFAQFERDIAGERIRDKLFATRKKGMWAGGNPPLGYRVPEEGEERKLFVLPEEAKLVQRIFDGYLAKQSLVVLARVLNRDGHTTKRWRTKSGQWFGGRRFTQKYLHRVLTNPVYIGRNVHTTGGETNNWPGLHEAIITDEVWDRVQAVMKKLDRKSQHRWSEPYLLKGKLRTGDGFAMSPSSVHRRGKRKTQKRLVRYYVSQRAIQNGYRECPIKTVNASHLDDLVRALVLDHLDSLKIDELATQPREVRDHWVREIIDSIVLNVDRLTVRLYQEQIESCRNQDWEHEKTATKTPRPTCPFKAEVKSRGRLKTLSLAIQIKLLDGRRLLLSPEGRDLVFPSIPEPKEYIVNAIGLAYRWHDEIVESRKSLIEVAAQDGISEGRIRKLLPLTHLSPRILKLALTGLLPPSITLSDLLTAAEHPDWDLQARSLGLETDDDGKVRRKRRLESRNRTDGSVTRPAISS